MTKEIKELRVKIDGLAQLTKELKPLKEPYCIDAMNTIVKEQRPNINSKEIEKAYDSLILAKAWLGKALGELGENTPYGNDGTRKSVKDIEPAADTHKGIKHLEEKGNWNTDYNHIEKVDWLRQKINILIEDLPNYSTYVEKIIEQKEAECVTKQDFGDIDFSDIPDLEYELTFVYKYLSEARFWLGFELERIKNTEK